MKTKAWKLNMPVEELEFSPRLANSSAFSKCLNGHTEAAVGWPHGRDPLPPSALESLWT